MDRDFNGGGSSGGMHVLIIDDWGGWGGAEKIIFTLATSLRSDSTRFSFLLGTTGELYQRLRHSEFPVEEVRMQTLSLPRSLRALRPLLAVWFLIRIVYYALHAAAKIGRINPTLIQTSSPQSDLVGSIAAVLTRRKLLWHVQGITPRGPKRLLFRTLARWLPAVIVVPSQAVADVYSGRGLQDKVRLVRSGIQDPLNTVSDKRASRAWLEESEGIAGRRVILFPSMILPGKGFDLFVKIAARVRSVVPGVVFLVAGDSRFKKDHEYKERVLASPTARGLGTSLRLLGFRTDVLRLIHASDCIVHCPVADDALPTVVLEAMALRTPVVGTRIGGIPEQIDDLKTGYLVPPGDSDGFADRVLRILRSPGEHLAMTERARAKFLAEFSSTGFANQFERVYAELNRGIAGPSNIRTGAVP